MSKPPPMGHNGFSFETRADLPDDLPKLFFAKFTMQDLLDDLLKMPKEERGVYMTALIVMYKEMESLPADDKKAAMSLGLDVREWRNIKPRLMARGVLYERATGRISNRRFEAEICAYVTEFRNRREAAIERERRKRQAAEIPPTWTTDRRQIADRSPTDRRHLSDRSPTSASYLGDNFSKNTNKNNVGNTTNAAQDDHEAQTRARVLQTTSYESLVSKEKNHTHTPTSAAAPAGSGAGIDDDVDETEKLDPDLRRAADILAPIFGSASEPDFDGAYRCVSDFAQSSLYTLEDVVNAAMDVGLHKSRGDTRAWTVTPRSFGNWVRQAKKDRTQTEASATLSEKAPAPVRRIPPGEFAPGFVMGEDGRVTLINGKRAEWLERFGDNATLLDMTLIAASNNIKPNSPTPPPAQVEAQLAKACRDIVVRAENARKSAELRMQREAEADKARSGMVPGETDEARMLRLLKEA